MTVCRAGSATHMQAHRQVCDARTFFNVISGGSRAGKMLGVSGVLDFADRSRR